MKHPQTIIVKKLYRLRDLRKSKGYTQEDLARKVGMTLRAYQKIEWNEYQNEGDYNPKLSTAVRIAKSLDVTIYDILEWYDTWHYDEKGTPLPVGINPNDKEDKHIYALEYKDPIHANLFNDRIAKTILSKQKKED